MVYQIDAECRRLLWVGKDRTTKTLLRFFRMLGKERSAVLRFVCSDMWKPYLKVIAKKAGQAVHVLDRFHVMAKMNKAIDEVRAAEAKRLKRDGYEPVLKHSRWCLLKRQENLTEKQAVKLSELLQYNLQSVRSRLMREDFQRFWEYRYPAWAAKFLDEWCTRTMRSKIDPMKKVARTLRRHRDLILNWFRAEGAISAGDCGGSEQQSKTDDEKSVWLSDGESHRNRPISPTWRPTRARIHPQILLKRLHVFPKNLRGLRFLSIALTLTSAPQSAKLDRT